MEEELNGAKIFFLQRSNFDLHNKVIVRGYDFNKGVNYEEIIKVYKTTGFQATNFQLAVDEINKMLLSRNKPLSKDDEDNYEEDEFIKRKHQCTIFFGYTSNSGMRENIRYLVQHSLIDCLVTSAGGIEEDLIKCLANTYLGSFNKFDGTTLPGKDRIENSIFENWIMPLLDEMLEDQKNFNMLWTPSKMIQRLGEKINNEDSIYYWAAKNKIPVFCPALTDGSLGDMMYFHSFRNPGLVLDILEDLRRINKIAMKAKQSGIIAIGGGVTKHHIMKANCIRDGSDYCVFINTAQEFDGSDSGASPDESVAAGKIKLNTTPVKLFCEASLVLPLLISDTFCKFQEH